jgi:hypothetical protein
MKRRLVKTLNMRGITNHEDMLAKKRAQEEEE